MGRVVNSKAFKHCSCYQIGETKEPADLLCYSEGVIGTLSDPQDLKCKSRDIEPIPKAMKKRMATFSRVSKDCAIDEDSPNTYESGGKTFKVTDLVSRSKCILAKAGE